MSKATVLPYNCLGDRPWLVGRATNETCDQKAELASRLNSMVPARSPAMRRSRSPIRIPRSSRRSRSGGRCSVKGTQGQEFQGGTLEGSVVRGAIDSDPLRPLRERAFVGFEQGVRRFTMKVVGEMKDPCLLPEKTLTLYELEIDGKNPCAEESLVPESARTILPACELEHWDTYRGKALAVEGGWGTQGAYVAPAGRYSFSTFSCLSGVVAKCLRFGYRPWEGGNQGELLQTCVRAARADYCGTGMSYTCEGTLFDVVDVSGIQEREANLPGEMLEADWAPEGAVCLNTPRLPGCSNPADQERLLSVIARECEGNHHAIRIGGCKESCAEGATCGRPIRTWAVAGQTNICRTSRDYCPEASP